MTSTCTPAYMVHVSCTKINPVVMAGVRAISFIPHQHSVPCNKVKIYNMKSWPVKLHKTYYFIENKIFCDFCVCVGISNLKGSLKQNLTD